MKECQAMLAMPMDGDELAKSCKSKSWELTRTPTD